ncbi:hypothetical protein O181_058812 [Austropuccinia psidii MF-1]|uniref:Uncharacterized protein n=1 Tax=Austropuccinia psidii MF-1 TaxID=1389203 RepID=A0A9Q3EFH0_9BASI|nr:hypothetical protein [Austropuccinia psidii MF-1]
MLTLCSLIFSSTANIPVFPEDNHSACYQALYGPKGNVKIPQRGGVAIMLPLENTQSPKTKYIAGASSICRSYNSDTDSVACLWDGTGSKTGASETPGWLTKQYKENCDKKISISGKSDAPPVEAQVSDGCQFYTKSDNIPLKTGCLNLFVSKSVRVNLGLSEAVPTPTCLDPQMNAIVTYQICSFDTIVITSPKGPYKPHGNKWGIVPEVSENIIGNES